MTAAMFEEGSVLRFTPVEAFDVELFLSISGEPIGEVFKEKAYGWAVVVTGKDGWVMDTRVEPMTICCGQLFPMMSHSAADHVVKGQPTTWQWRMGDQQVA